MAENIFDIADRLTAEGRKVTNRLIWDHIGGGSMTTIAGALRRWRERQQLQVEAPAARVALSEVVERAMCEAVERLAHTLAKAGIERDEARRRPPRCERTLPGCSVRSKR